jgi:hypothetical protein
MYPTELKPGSNLGDSQNVDTRGHVYLRIRFFSLPSNETVAVKRHIGIGDSLAHKGMLLSFVL